MLKENYESVQYTNNTMKKYHVGHRMLSSWHYEPFEQLM